MKEEGLVFINGVRSSDINALDRGLHYGDGVFRTLKVVAGEVRWWADHFGKLAGDCAALGLHCPDREVLAREVLQLAREADVGVIKIILTRGAARRGYGIPPDAAPTRIVMGFPPSVRENLDVHVRWCDLRLASQPKLAGIKHLNCLENVLARSEWTDTDIAEGLLMDEAGRVICATMANLFMVEQGSLVTPDLSRCGVAGVARARIIRAAQGHGQAVRVEPITRERLLASDEVFLCNSLIEIWRVTGLEDRQWRDGGWAEKTRNWINENN